ncbi:MAG: hypothetical protein ABW090_05375 [Sedimenticola sp.]
MGPKNGFLHQLKKSAIGFLHVVPMMLTVILLVGLIKVLVTAEMLSALFTGNPLLDTLIGTFAGGVSAGQPIASYILGGELLDQGISLYAVSAFLLSWVTLGIVQLPMEVEMFGRRFTVARNLLSLLFAILLALLTTVTLALLP